LNTINTNQTWNDFIKKAPAYSNASKKQQLDFKKTPEVKSQKHKKEENDPLLKYPTRMLAYSNEVGAAIQHLNHKLFLFMWVPALMYFGADIYDKYKRGENDDYQDPSSKRLVKQSVFQALASVILPTKAVHIGQNLACRISKTGFKDIDGKTLKTDSRAPLEFYDDLIERAKSGLFNDVIHKLDYKIETKPTPESAKKFEKAFIEEKLKNIYVAPTKGENLNTIIKDIVNNQKDESSLKAWINGSIEKVTKSNGSKKFKFLHKLAPEDLNKVISKEVDNIYKIKEFIKNNDIAGLKASNLINPKLIEKRVEPLFTKLAKDSDALLKETLNVYFSAKKSVPNKIKTIGGFIALAVAAIPIDYCVEKFIEKIVEPKLDQTEQKIKDIKTRLNMK